MHGADLRLWRLVLPAGRRVRAAAGGPLTGCTTYEPACWNETSCSRPGQAVHPDLLRKISIAFSIALMGRVNLMRLFVEIGHVAQGQVRPCRLHLCTPAKPNIAFDGVCQCDAHVLGSVFMSITWFCTNRPALPLMGCASILSRY